MHAVNPLTLFDGENSMFMVRNLRGLIEGALIVGLSCVLPLMAALTIAAPSPTGDGAETRLLAFNNRCRTCHTIKQGDNRLGPSLNGIIGRRAGSEPGYPFSAAMAQFGLVWDEATLDRFITNPESVVSGSNMQSFSGVADAGERKLIIDYLKRHGAPERQS
jgi:cytochrome c